jgi:hypothetical protein
VGWLVQQLVWCVGGLVLGLYEPLGVNLALPRVAMIVALQQQNAVLPACCWCGWKVSLTPAERKDGHPPVRDAKNGTHATGGKSGERERHAGHETCRARNTGQNSNSNAGLMGDRNQAKSVWGAPPSSYDVCELLRLALAQPVLCTSSFAHCVQLLAALVSRLI